jgi:DNA-binding NarL/FixJ family response regulator
MYLRAIAAEVLEWRLKFKRLQILGKLHLTEEERELLMLFRQGYSSREIAILINRSKAAIDQKFSRTARRLGVKSRQQAGTLAWELGLLS